MHKPFVSMVKFKVLAHFPVDHLDGLSLESEWQHSPQVSRTILSIFADLGLYTKPLWIVPSARITIGITVMFYSFFLVLGQCLSTYLFFCFFFFFTMQSPSTAKPTIRWVLFLLTITRSGSLAGIRWSVCIVKYRKIQESFMCLIP